MARKISVAGIAGLLILLSAGVVFGEVTRTVVQRTDLSIPGREVVTARANFPAGEALGPHTHPGDEVSYVIEGSVEVTIEGVSRVYKAGEAFHVPEGKVHDARSVGGPAVLVANFLIEKGKPVSTAVAAQ